VDANVVATGLLDDPATGMGDEQTSDPADPADPAGTGADVDGGGTASVVAFSPRPAPAVAAPDPVTSAPAAASPASAAPAPAAGSADGEPGTTAAAGAALVRRRRAGGGPGKRELRYQQTREAIVDAATDLFTERGFDAVSVSEIARRAGVVEKTVFNHFPVKEGLVFETDPPIRAALLATVARRRSGESVSAAAGSFVVAAISQLGAPEAAEGVAAMARVIRGSRTLQVREREILGMLTDALAAHLTAETGAEPGDLEPWLAANAVLGLYSTLLELARDRVLAGDSGPELVEELRRRGRRGLALLQFGLAGYAKRR